MYDFEKGRIKLIQGWKYPHCHSLFIDDEIRALIDAASKEDVLLKIHRERPIDILMASHGHEDHLCYNYLFPDAQFWVHRADSHIFEDLNNLIDCYADDMSPENRREWEEFLIKACNYLPKKADRFLEDGEIISFGKVKMEVLHTPGHTPGHLSFYFPEERIVFAGDIDLVDAGPYYGDVESSIEEMIESLNRLKSYSCDFYLTAHGKGIYKGDPSILDRYLNSIFKREEALICFLKTSPLTLDEITEKGIIYGKKRKIGPWDMGLSERMMIKKHLSFLEKRGIIRKEGDYYIYDSW